LLNVRSGGSIAFRNSRVTAFVRGIGVVQRVGDGTRVEHELQTMLCQLAPSAGSMTSPRAVDYQGIYQQHGIIVYPPYPAWPEELVM